MARSKDEWIAKAFEEAGINRKETDLGACADEAHSVFVKEFPIILLSFAQTFGVGEAEKTMKQIKENPMLVKLLCVTFGTGMIYNKFLKGIK